LVKDNRRWNKRHKVMEWGQGDSWRPY
jgi:hypothetical protein